MTRFKLGAVREFAINEAHPFEFDGEEIVVRSEEHTSELQSH